MRRSRVHRPERGEASGLFFFGLGWLVGGWVGGGRGAVPKGAISGDTYSIRHVQGSYYLPPRGYFNVHLTEEEPRLGEGLVFWVFLCTPSGCLFTVLYPLTTQSHP